MRVLWPVTTDSGEKVESEDIAALRVDDPELATSSMPTDALKK
jgi:hypothetical protein